MPGIRRKPVSTDGLLGVVPGAVRRKPVAASGQYQQGRIAVPARVGSTDFVQRRRRSMNTRTSSTEVPERVWQAMEQNGTAFCQTQTKATLQTCARLLCRR